MDTHKFMIICYEDKEVKIKFKYRLSSLQRQSMQIVLTQMELKILTRSTWESSELTTEPSQDGIQFSIRNISEVNVFLIKELL